MRDRCSDHDGKRCRARSIRPCPSFLRRPPSRHVWGQHAAATRPVWPLSSRAISAYAGKVNHFDSPFIEGSHRVISQGSESLYNDFGQKVWSRRDCPWGKPTYRHAAKWQVLLGLRAKSATRRLVPIVMAVAQTQTIADTTLVALWRNVPYATAP